MRFNMFITNISYIENVTLIVNLSILSDIYYSSTFTTIYNFKAPQSRSITSYSRSFYRTAS